MIMCHSAGNWGFYTIISLLPKYMADYQGKQIKEIGVMSSLPYVLQTVTILIATALADMLQVSSRFCDIIQIPSVFGFEQFAVNFWSGDKQSFELGLF